MKKLFLTILFVLLLASTALTQPLPNAILSWDAHSDSRIIGYIVHYGKVARDSEEFIYEKQANVSNVTTIDTRQVLDIDSGVYYFCITGYGFKVRTLKSIEVNYDYTVSDDITFLAPVGNVRIKTK